MVPEFGGISIAIAFPAAALTLKISEIQSPGIYIGYDDRQLGWYSYGNEGYQEYNHYLAIRK